MGNFFFCAVKGSAKGMSKDIVKDMVEVRSKETGLVKIYNPGHNILELYNVSNLSQVN